MFYSLARVILSVIGIALCIAFLYFTTCLTIMFCTGYNYNEAAELVREKVRGFFEEPLNFDYNYICSEIDARVHNVIGNQSYNALVGLARAGANPPLIFFSRAGGLPVIDITVNANSTQKAQLESVLVGFLKSYLISLGYSGKVIYCWKYRPDLKLPYLELKYSTKEKEYRILERNIQEIRKKEIAKYAPLIDNTEDEDLTGNKKKHD